MILEHQTRRQKGHFSAYNNDKGSLFYDENLPRYYSPGIIILLYIGSKLENDKLYSILKFLKSDSKWQRFTHFVGIIVSLPRIPPTLHI